MKTLNTLLMVISITSLWSNSNASKAPNAGHTKPKEMRKMQYQPITTWTKKHMETLEVISIALQSKKLANLRLAIQYSETLKNSGLNIQAKRTDVPHDEQETLAQFAVWTDKTCANADPNDQSYKNKGKQMSEMFPGEWKQLMEILNS